MFAAKLKALPRAYRNLSSLQLLFWSTVAVGSYLTVFLQKQGFNPNQVGLINAVVSTVAIMATPFWGMVADRIQSIRKIFMVCLSAAMCLWALMPTASRISIGPLALIYVAVIIWAFFCNPAYSLFDAFLVQRADVDGVAYGHVRLWGSFSFALMSFLLSFIFPYTGVEFTFYFYGICFLPLLFIMGKMKGTDTGRRSGNTGPQNSQPPRNIGIGKLFKSYYFITYLFFAVLVYMFMNTVMTFSPFLLETFGEDTARFSLLIAFRAMAEIPLLFLMRTLRRRLPLPFIISTAAFIFLIEGFFYIGVKNFYQVLMLQIVGGMGQGIMIGAASNYVYSLAPKGLNSTAHTIHGAVIAAASIFGNLIGGNIIQSMGIFMYYRIMCMILLFALVYFCSSIAIGLKLLKKPIPFLKAV